MNSLKINLKKDPRWQLEDSLCGNQVTSVFEGNHQTFWPQQIIDRLIDRDVVIREFKWTDFDVDLDNDKDDLISYILHDAKKLFAIAAGSGVQEEKLSTIMTRFKDNKLSDRDMSAEVDSPNRVDTDLLADFLERLGDKELRLALRNRFIEYRWRALVPVISTERANYIFKAAAILPFVEHRTESGDMVKRGAFSRVHKVSICPGHYEDPHCPEGENPPTAFAVKEIRPPDEERQFVADDWVKESDVLKMMNKKGTKHIVRFITAFRREESVRNMSYYLMFEWADGGSLEDLWATNKFPSLVPDVVKEAMQQFLGLAEALFATHYDSEDGESGTRHGDVKPANILRFRPTATNIFGQLKIGDWGLAKYHNTGTVKRGQNTNTKYGTILYEPPEVKVGPLKILGRQYDVWSMGCVMLELIIWLLYGYEELERYRKDIQGLSSDSVPCYRIASGGTAKVHEVVVHWVDHLAQDPACEEHKALGELLNLIRKRLLVVELSPLKGQGTSFYKKEAQSRDASGSPQDAKQEDIDPGASTAKSAGTHDAVMPAQVPRLELTLAKSDDTQDPKPTRQTQVYRATSEDLMIALEHILDDEDRPDDYWETKVPNNYQRKGPQTLSRLTKVTRDFAGRLTIEYVSKSQSLQRDWTPPADRMAQLAVQDRAPVSSKPAALE